MKRILYIIGVAGVLFSACTKKDDVGTGEQSALKITSGIATRASGTVWDDNDQIGVFASQGSTVLGDNAPFTTDLGGATANFTNDGEPIYYPKVGAMDIVAYYPYVASTTLTAYAVDVATQTDPSAIDLMSAKASAETQNTPLSMRFYHRLSQLSLTIVAGAGVSDADLAGTEITILGLVSDATYNLSSDAIELGSTVTELEFNVNSDVSSASAIAIPQSVSNSVRLKFYVPSIGTLYTLINEVELQSGKNHKFTATINSNRLDLSGSTIEDWDAQTATGDDDMTLNDAMTVAQIVAHTPQTSTWRIRTSEGNDGITAAELTSLFELLDNVSNQIDVIFVDAKSIPSLYTSYSSKAAMLRSVSSSTVTQVGSYAFQNCDALETISLSEATVINSYAFSNCDALTTVTLPKAEEIGSYAFQNCDVLKTISLPEVTSIDSYSFFGCDALTTVSMAKAQSVGSYAFRRCHYLTDIYLPTATLVEDYAFDGCTTLSTISLPEVTKLGISVFGECSALEIVSLPMVTEVENNAFSDCTTLKTITLPKVTLMSSYLFDGCTSLKVVIMPKAIKIDSYTLYHCSSLTTIKIGTELSAEPTTEEIDINTSAFDGITHININLTVGYGTVSADGKKWTPKTGATEFGPFLSVTK